MDGFRGSNGARTPRPDVFREDKTYNLRASVHNRALTFYGFSPEVSLIHEVRKTNAQLYDYKKHRWRIAGGTAVLRTLRVVIPGDPHPDPLPEGEGVGWRWHCLPWILTWIQWLLESYAFWLKRELVERTGSMDEQSRRLFLAPFVVVSHAESPDPILNYGNQQALDLWETTWAEFTATRSRLTAEPVNRDERARTLQRVAAHGFRHRLPGGAHLAHPPAFPRGAGYGVERAGRARDQTGAGGHLLAVDAAGRGS